MEFVLSVFASTLLVSSAVMVMLIIAAATGLTGRILARPPRLLCLKTEPSAQDFTVDARGILTFKTRGALLLQKGGGYEIVDVGYHVQLPDDHCGILVLRTENFVDTQQRLHKDISTGANVLAPGYSGPVTMEIWNKHNEEPAGIAGGQEILDLYLVSTTARVRVEKKL